MHEPHEDPKTPSITRREALAKSLRLLGAGSVGLGLVGCASSRTSYTPMSAADRARLREPVSVRPYKPAWSGPNPAIGMGSGIASAIPRSEWTRATPVPKLMDRMKPINRITIHHDGMTSFTSTSRGAAAARIEIIRNGHRDRNWGDVGYHFLIDPSGRVWAGRPLEWQGAHVRAQNEGNIGICVMGNYERQRPNSAQLASIERSVAELMVGYNIPLNRVHTHRELDATACPGKNLQPRLVSMRSPRGTLARV